MTNKEQYEIILNMKFLDWRRMRAPYHSACFSAAFENYHHESLLLRYCAIGPGIIYDHFDLVALKSIYPDFGTLMSAILELEGSKESLYYLDLFRQRICLDPFENSLLLERSLHNYFEIK